MSRQTTPPLLAAGAATSPAWTPAAAPPQAAPPQGAPQGPSPAPPQGAPQGPPPPPLGPPAPGFPHGAPPVTKQAPPGGPPPNFIAKDRYDGPPAPQRFVLAALAIAGFAGLLVSGNTPGLSLAIVAAAILAATLLLDAPRTGFRWACLAAAGLLAIVPALRDSGWVGTLSLLGAMTLGAISVSSPGSWRELGVASFGWMAKLIPAPIRLLARQGGEAAQVRWRSAAPVLRGTLLGLVLLLIFGALFASADARFAQIADDLLSIDLSFETLWERAWIIVLVLAAAGALWLTAATRRERPAKPASSKLGATEWLIALGLLTAMFAAFVTLQLGVLFGSDDTVQLTSGLTYAEYARQGFGQMTVAAILTLGVVAAAARYGPADQLGVRLLCGVLCVLTLIVLASAMHRLGLYQDAFGSTRVRFSMTALMYWLGAVLLVLVTAGATRRTALLPRVLVLLSAAFAIGTVAVNPDHRIAERNVQRFEQTGRLDAPFLTTLSADAVPALVQLPPRWGACLQASFADRLDRPERIASWNGGRARARAALDPAIVAAGSAQLRGHGGRSGCPSP